MKKKIEKVTKQFLKNGMSVLCQYKGDIEIFSKALVS